MQTWREGDKTIDIKYAGTRIFLCVEHPALVSNPDKAIETLGGLDNLEEVHKPVNKSVSQNNQNY